MFDSGLKCSEIAGRENSETRWHGYVCHCSHYYVLCYASSLNSEGDNLLKL